MLTAIIPTKNHGHFLGDLITRCFLPQESPVTEVLICNDASSDDTDYILKQFSNVKKLKVFHNEESIGGIRSNIKTYKHATTPYVMFMSSDDYFFPEKMSLLLYKMITQDAYVGFGKYLIDSDDDLIPLNHSGWQARAHQKGSDFLTLFGFDHYMFLCTTIFKRQYLPRYGMELAPFDESLDDLAKCDGLGEFRGHDWNLTLEMSRKYPDKIAFFDDYCGCFRKIDGQLSSDEKYIVTGRAAYEMAILILRHLTNFDSRKKFIENPTYMLAMKSLLTHKISKIPEKEITSQRFISHYAPIIYSAKSLIEHY